MVKELKTCMKEHSTLVKLSAILLGILIVILIGLFILLVVQKDNHTCNTDHCIKVSAEIIRYIDSSENPCEDFHEFVCGNFMENQKELPPPQALQQLNVMIASPIVSTDSRIFQMEKMFYQSCVNLAAIDMNQEDTILDMFHRLGDWPLLHGANWNDSRYHWKDFAIQSKTMGLKFEWFLEFRIHEDVNNSRMNILKIDIPRYLKPVGNDQRHFRKELLTDIAVFLGAPKNIVHYETSKTIDFEDELAIIAEKHRQRRYRNESSTRLTISQVQHLWPSVLWLDLINKITKNRFTEFDYVAFDILDYIRDLNRLLMGTHKRIQVDFMMWKLIEETFWPYLSQPIRAKFEKYNREVLKEKVEYNRDRFCTLEAQKYFPLIAESVYIRQHVTEEKKLLVREMAGLIQRQLIKLVDTASWMNRDRNIRRNALRKIQEVSFIIGAPDMMFNEDFGITPGFEFRSMNVIQMIEERQSRAFDEYYVLLNQGVSLERIGHYKQFMSITNYSMVNDHTMIIPAKVLEDSFYNPRLPNYLNYATIGRSLAGALFDHLYKENETYSWWASDAFDNIIKCLMKEAANFPHSEFKRSRKLRDSLKDFVAVDVAYEAYREWMRMQPQEVMLPGLKLSPFQLFWIQTSKTACSKIYSRHDRDNSRFKVIGPLRNSRYFAEEYDCPVGSRMNPSRKCRVL